MTRPGAILANAAHRPWPLPARRWVMRQSWHDLAFFHWAVDPKALRPSIPAPLEIDTWPDAHGAPKAWVGVVPFRMSGIRLRGLPAVPGTRAFPELNVRTYVRMPGSDPKPGVWFFSLDAANGLAVRVARAWFHLPYFRARMRCSSHHAGGAYGAAIDYHAERVHRGAPPAEYRARYAPSGPVEHARAGTHVHWLTERYALYAAHPKGHLLRGDIHHVPWPLQPCSFEIERDTVAAAAGIALDGPPPLAHFARRLDVLAWAPMRCPRGEILVT